MLTDRIQTLFDEPACAHNRAKDDKTRRAGCGKQLTPGAAAGGCAFDGAKIVLQPITDCAHLVHGPIACEGNSWDGRHAASSGPMLYRTGLTTDLSELDVIYGGEKKLYRAIKEVISRFDPPAVFVYQTCVTALVGDDIVKVCKAASERLNKPVIPVVSPGFVGKKNLGTKLAGQVLLDYVIGTEEPETVTSTDINIIGDYNVAGELWLVKPLLEKLGIRVLASITGDARYHDITKAHRARVNIMVCSQALLSLARKMEERWGIPYFEGSFYGVSDTSHSLRTLAKMLVERGAPADLIQRTETLIAEEEARVWRKLAPITARLTGKKVLLYTGGVKSWSVISALQDAGMIVIGTSVRKATKGDKERARELLGEGALIFETMPQTEMYGRLKSGEADILLSGGRTQFVALKAKVPWLDINQESRDAYAGYEGIVTLIGNIDRAIANPIWSQVRAPAPWEA
jgi:nitrogenase molybdenum-cofactor synthesis protein NifE